MFVAPSGSLVIGSFRKEPKFLLHGPGVKTTLNIIVLMHNLMHIFSISVSDLPISANYPSTMATITSLDGKGVYVQYNEKFYELDCTTTCTWTVMSQTLPKAVNHAIMMYLPPEVTCFS